MLIFQALDSVFLLCYFPRYGIWTQNLHISRPRNRSLRLHLWSSSDFSDEAGHRTKSVGFRTAKYAPLVAASVPRAVGIIALLTNTGWASNCIECAEIMVQCHYFFERIIVNQKVKMQRWATHGAQRISVLVQRLAFLNSSELSKVNMRVGFWYAMLENSCTSVSSVMFLLVNPVRFLLCLFFFF